LFKVLECTVLDPDCSINFSRCYWVYWCGPRLQC